MVSQSCFEKNLLLFLIRLFQIKTSYDIRVTNKWFFYQNGLQKSYKTVFIIELNVLKLDVGFFDH